MKKNILVAGCGYWGKNLVRNFHELGTLKYLSDPNESLVAPLCEEYDLENIKFEEGLADKEIEGVVIASPAQLHASMAIQAMELGKNVFIEKPLALSKHEAINMIESSKKNGVKIMVGHLMHYHSAFNKMKEIVQSGELGTLKYISSNRLSTGKIRTEEDVIWSFAPHDISMILSLMQDMPISIRANGINILSSSISDTASLDLIFKNAQAKISVSWLHPYKEQKLVLTFDECFVIFDDTLGWDKKLSFLDFKISKENGNPIISKKDAKFIPLIEKEPLSNECKYFIDLIEGKVVDRTDGNEGLRVLQVLEAASQSLEKNAEVII